MDDINKARILVCSIFDGVTDKAGKPYSEHCFRVAGRLPDESTDAERCAALLHDVIEDTAITAADLRGYGFSERCVSLVEALTRPRDGTTYMDYIRSIKASGDAGLIAIKLADNADNSSPDRIAALPEAERDIVRRYERARKILTA